MKEKLTKEDIICLVIFILLIVVAVGMVILRVWAFINYADVPVKDIPLWVVWLLGEYE